MQDITCQSNCCRQSVLPSTDANPGPRRSASANFPLLFLLLIIGLISCQPDPVVIETHFLPNKTYNTQMTGRSESLVNVSGEATRIAQIEATGVKLPMEVVTSNELELMIRTGNEGKSGNFPATVIYKNGTSSQSSNGKQETVSSPISGLVVRGTYKSDHSFIVDTILSDKVDESSKEVYAALL